MHTRTHTRRVGRLKDQMAEICVKAVLSVADLARRDVNLDLIKVRVWGVCCGQGLCALKAVCARKCVCGGCLGAV